jgi:4-carboxymuconolactone decarboxylase
MTDYDRSKGLAKFAEVYGGELGALPAAGASPFIDYMLETLFGALWSDETLSIRERRLLLVGALAAQGDEVALTIHLRAAIKRGEFTAQQLQALATFLTQYVGYPRGSRLFRVIGELLNSPAPPNSR